MRKILGILEVFLGVFEKTKEKKDREFRTLQYSIDAMCSPRGAT